MRPAGQLPLPRKGGADILGPMFGFLIKKAFFDYWDNMGRMIVQNFVMMGLTMAFLFIPAALGSRADWIIILWAVIYLVYFVYAGTLFYLVAQASEGKSDEFPSVREAVSKMAVPSLLMALLNGLMAVSLTVGLRFYLSLHSFWGVLAATVMFWIMLILFLGFQFFFPAYVRIRSTFFGALKKALILFLDNPLNSLAIILWGQLLTVVSFLLMFFMPGPSGVYLWYDEAVRMLLKKYDYLEENPEAPPKRIPWRVVTMQDREILGSRTIRNTIFPWK